MMNSRQIFLQHIAQTSPAPVGLEMNKASGIYQYDVSGKTYIDFISGFSVCNIGHSHAAVVKAVQEQAAKYMHLIVYGEFIEHPQTAYAQLLIQHLPKPLETIYFTNSGAEAVEGAMKLAKRVTHRPNIFAFNNCYHGSTQGALSLMGNEYWRNPFRPLLPGIYHFNYGSEEVLQAINEQTACVIVEAVQAEAGIIKANKNWLHQLYDKCKQTGTLLILDEIQTGFGRTGSLWAFEQYNIVPDILLLGKALGGGMPLGAFISSYNNMQQFTYNPVLGHITTFGGHPVSCAAGKAALEVLLEGNFTASVFHKEQLLQQYLQHHAIKQLRTAGLWAALDFGTFELNKKIIERCIENGLIVDWFIFAPHCMRIAPPLIISDEELQTSCHILLQSIDEALKN